MSSETVGWSSRASAAAIAIGPITLALALLWHPTLTGRLPDAGAVADAAAADMTRWGLSHLAAAFASAAVAISFIAFRHQLRAWGDPVISAVGLVFVVLGSTLFAVLPGMEMSILAAHETGTDLVATQRALEPWFVAILGIGGVAFMLGAVAFAVATVRHAPLGRATTALVATALSGWGVCRLAPLGELQFHVQSAAGLLALLPVAVVVWRRS